MPVSNFRGGVIAVTLAILALIGVSRSDAAITNYGFNPVTNNNAANVADAQAQLFVQVTDVGVGTNQVKFIFRNLGPEAMSITDLYFDDGELLGISSIENGWGVDFADGASPGELPGGNTIDWNNSEGAHFDADSESPTQPNGVNPGEYVAIIFDLQSGKVYADVIASINLSLATPGVDVVGGLRIGIHVQGFDGGGSEGLVNGGPSPTPIPTIPEPASLALWMLGLAVTGIGARRLRQSK